MTNLNNAMVDSFGTKNVNGMQTIADFIEAEDDKWLYKNEILLIMCYMFKREITDSKKLEEILYSVNSSNYIECIESIQQIKTKGTVSLFIDAIIEAIKTAFGNGQYDTIYMLDSIMLSVEKFAYAEWVRNEEILPIEMKKTFYVEMVIARIKKLLYI